MDLQQKLTRMGIELPELDPSYDVETYGKMIPHFSVGCQRSTGGEFILGELERRSAQRRDTRQRG